MDNIFNATGPMIIMLDYGTLQTNNNSFLPLPSTLSPAATIATIVPGLNISSLLSLGWLCGDGCNVILNKQNIYAIKEK